MRAIVTGGAGFIGQHLVLDLVERGWDVWVLDALTYAASGRDRLWRVLGEWSPACMADHHRLLQGDVCDPLDVGAVLRAVQPEVVYHLAAESHVDASLQRPADAMRVNAVGTLVVAQACAQAGVPLVYCSTDEVYGDVAGTRWDEEGADELATPLAPSSPYSAGKAAGEHAVHAVARSYGLQAVITRGSNAWGPGQYPEKLVPIACRLLSRGEPVPLHGGGDQVRQWVHVAEFSDCLVRAGAYLLNGPAWRREPGGGVAREWPTDQVPVWNIAGPCRLSVRELVLLLADVAGVPPERATRDTPDRPGQDRAYHVSGERAEIMLGFRPRRGIVNRHELQRLLEHYDQGSAQATHVADYARPGA